MIALLGASIPSVTAQAESLAMEYPGLKTAAGKSQTQTASLSAFTTSIKPVLDGRNPSYTMKFDVPETDWASSLRLSLSADPVGDMPLDADIYVQLNQSTPIKIATRGRGFDASLSLETAGIRPRDNVLNIFYKAPNETDCLSSQAGGWALNLNASKLTLQSRAKSRPFIVSDIEARLSNPLTTPKRVSLVSHGHNATQIQSLLAQAIGMRLDKAPEFTAVPGAGEIEFIAGRRDKISRFVNSEAVMTSEGPRLALDEGRPMRVILTGDTDEQVLDLVKSFSQHYLPDTRRAMVSTGEIRMQTRLSTDKVLTAGRIKLTDLRAESFESGWGHNQMSLRFDVTDPVASKGELLLNLQTPDTLLGQNNTATVLLNGLSIGQTPLNKINKSVAFQIPPSALQGQDNILTLEPQISSQAIAGCQAQIYRSNEIYFGKGSHLTLSQERETPLSDLSRLTATGAPFSDASGKKTVLVLPENDIDYFAALGFLTKLAKTSGKSWSDAVYIRGTDQIEMFGQDRNVLFITPPRDIPESAKAAAPKSLLSALRGNPETGENLLSVNVDRYTSSSNQTVQQDFAMRTTRRNRIDRGGVAALFASPYQAKKMVGIISNVPGEQFERAIETFSEPGHWNEMEGQVARWNKESVLMAELSSPLPNFERTFFPPSSSGFNWPKINFSEVVFTVPEINLPKVDWTDMKDTVFFWKKDAEISPAPILEGAPSDLGLRSSTDKLSPPMIKQSWGARQLSAIAFILMLLFGLALVFVGLSEPRSRSREYR